MTYLPLTSVEIARLKMAIPEETLNLDGVPAKYIREIYAQYLTDPANSFIDLLVSLSFHRDEDRDSLYERIEFFGSLRVMIFSESWYLTYQKLGEEVWDAKDQTSTAENDFAEDWRKLERRYNEVSALMAKEQSLKILVRESTKALLIPPAELKTQEQWDYYEILSNPLLQMIEYSQKLNS